MPDLSTTSDSRARRCTQIERAKFSQTGTVFLVSAFIFPFTEGSFVAKRIRVTKRTDTRGTVNLDYRGSYETQALSVAAKAGIPGILLDSAGWNEDPNDLEGYYAHLVYEIGDVEFTAPDCVQRLARIIDEMHAICRKAGVSPVDAMKPVYGLAKFKRELHQARNGELPNESSDDDYDAFGAPSGPEQDGHGHGLALGAWICLREE